MTYLSATAVPSFPKTTGLYYTSFGTIGTSALTAGFITACPVRIPYPMAIDRIGINITAAVAATTISVGIYGSSGAVPNTLLLDGGSIDSTTTGSKENTVSYTIQPGLVWLAVLALGGGPTIQVITAGPAVPATTLAAATAARTPGVTSAGSQASLVTTFPTPVQATIAPVVAIRAA